jgi:RimJ/RimL family protein N-acetyltransferase
MEGRLNALGQPIGPELPGWTARSLPPRSVMRGRYCTIEPLDPGRHAGDLFAANARDFEGRMWTYLPYGPFPSADSYRQWAEEAAASPDPLFHAIIDARTGRAAGVASYLRIDPAAGAIEVGHIALSPSLQRTAAATEAMYLMACRAFDELFYRRYEWKCDDLNAGSRAAAERLGFTYEGCFRQATVYKRRNRDTAWYAIVDRDWPVLRARLERWLDPRNFDQSGRQRAALSELASAPAK